MHKFTVDLPKKHGRGGQSALRFARLRMEKRHNYVRKVAETAVQLFISNDKPNISGMILAGSADFKTELSQSDMFDPRLQGKIIKLVDVSYGGNFLVLIFKDFVSLLKGQKISKANYGVLNSPKKRTSSSLRIVSFVRFLGELRQP